MHLWDSVHRGLEKASQGAGRIARIQRLRSAIDKGGRQLQEQEATLLATTMQLFQANVLTQPELRVICQEIAQLHQQLAQLRYELDQVQATPAGPVANTDPASGSAPTPSSPQLPSLSPPTMPAPSFAYAPLPSVPTAPVPPPFTYEAQSLLNQGGSAETLPPSASHSYIDPSGSIPVPPPPPEVTVSSIATQIVPPPPPSTGPDHTVSLMETQLMPPSTPLSTSQQVCGRCGQVVSANTAFCQHCGASLSNIEQVATTLTPPPPPAWTAPEIAPPTPPVVDEAVESATGDQAEPAAAAPPPLLSSTSDTGVSPDQDADVSAAPGLATSQPEQEQDDDATIRASLPQKEQAQPEPAPEE